MGEHGFGCVCLDCSGNKIADGAYELNSGLARQRSGLESHDPDPACACPRCDGMRSVAGFPQAAKGFRFTPGSLAALAEAQERAAELSAMRQRMNPFLFTPGALATVAAEAQAEAASRYGTQAGDESEAEPLRDPVTPMDEAIGAALRAECLKVFGSTWSNDIAWRFAQVAQRAMAAAAPAGFDWRGLAEKQALRIAALEADCDAWKGVAQDLIELKEGYRVQAREAQAEVRRLTGAMAEQGNHDWKGPTREEIDLDTGKTVRRAVPDPVAEQVHRVVGDVLAGKVLPAQREQLGDALGNAPKHTKSTASTDAPMPGKAIRLARADVGLKLP